MKYSVELINNMEDFPEKSVIPCSVLFENQEIGGIFIICPPQEIEYFEIKQSPSPEPPLKFRMLNFKKEIFVIEIWMQFGENPEKYLKMHLNPHDEQVRRFLALVSETNMISFHFYNTSSHDISLAITNLNDEEEGWFIRSYKLSTGLAPNRHDYQAVADHLYDGVSGVDRVFKFHDAGRSDFFIHEGGQQVALQEI